MSSTRAPFRHSTRLSAPVDVPLNFKQTCRKVRVVFSPITTIPGSWRTGGRREPGEASRRILEVTASLCFCDSSPRGSCTVCCPLRPASAINFVIGKSGGGGGGAGFLARTICLCSPDALLFLALGFGFFTVAFMAQRETGVEFCKYEYFWIGCNA